MPTPNPILEKYPKLSPYFSPLPITNKCLAVTSKNADTLIVKIAGDDIAHSVEINLSEESGQWENGTEWEQIYQDNVRCGDMWGANSPYKVDGFDSWLEDMFAKLIDEHIRWRAEGVIPNSGELKHVRQQHEALAQLVAYGRTMPMMQSYAWFKKARLLIALCHWMDSGEGFDGLCKLSQSFAGYELDPWWSKTVLPHLPGELPESLLESVVKAVRQGIQSGHNRHQCEAIEHPQYYYDKVPKLSQQIFSKVYELILNHFKTAAELVVLAKYFHSYSETVLFWASAKKFFEEEAEDNPKLHREIYDHLVLEYQRLGLNEKLAALQAEGAPEVELEPPSLDDEPYIQQLTDTYNTELRVLYGHLSPEGGEPFELYHEQALSVVELEKQINQYWLELESKSSESLDLSRRVRLDGAAAYMAFVTNRKNMTVAIDFLMEFLTCRVDTEAAPIEDYAVYSSIKYLLETFIRLPDTEPYHSAMSPLLDIVIDKWTDRNQDDIAGALCIIGRVEASIPLLHDFIEIHDQFWVIEKMDWFASLRANPNLFEQLKNQSES